MGSYKLDKAHISTASTTISIDIAWAKRISQVRVRIATTSRGTLKELRSDWLRFFIQIWGSGKMQMKACKP
jgi:hypothetical protein